MASKRLISIDVTVEPHEPIFEDIQKVKTDAERIAELENMILENEGVI